MNKDKYIKTPTLILLNLSFIIDNNKIPFQCKIYLYKYDAFITIIVILLLY
jgi:hypothetical protein